MSVMYGYDVAPANDPFVALVEVTQDVFEHGMSLRLARQFHASAATRPGVVPRCRVQAIRYLREESSLLSSLRGRSNTCWITWWDDSVVHWELNGELTSNLGRPKGPARHCVVSSLLDGCESERIDKCCARLLGQDMEVCLDYREKLFADLCLCPKSWSEHGEILLSI